MNSRKYYPWLFIFVVSFNVQAQDYFTVPRLNKEIVFDGIPNEEAWKSIPALPMVMHTPIQNGEMSDKAEIRIAYDDTYLYLSGILHYPSSEDIRNVSKKRDYFDAGIDFFGLIIDSFNDNENALGFFTAPSALRLDFAVFNDAQGELPLNPSWNTFWDASCKIQDNIWFTEMRIPFSSLRFQDENGEVIMGITIWRYTTYNNESTSFPEVPNDRGDFSLAKPSLARKVKFEGIKPEKPLYFAPYISGGLTQEAELNSDGSGYHHKDDWDFGAGFDLKYSFSSNFTVDVTVNPDFAQVEADDQVVNLTRFSLFFPEKRLFFQERASLFDFKLGGPNSLFYSRRIGINEDLERPVPIYGGIRVIARAGTWDFGLIDMQTAEIEGLPSANSGVLRIKKRMFNQNSYIGAMVTNQIDTDGNYNTAAGVDATVRIINNDFLEVNYVQTFESDSLNSPFALDNAKLRFNLEKREQTGFGYDLSWHRIGWEYNPALGFENRENTTRWGADFWYGWLPPEGSRIFLHQPRIKGAIFRKNGLGYSESSEAGVAWRVSTKTGAAVIPEYTYQVEFLADTFELSDEAIIPPGRYDFHVGNMMFITSASHRIFAFGNISVGEFYDGFQVVTFISPVWKMSPTVEIGGDYIYNFVNFKNRNQEFVAHVARLRTTLNFTTKLSFSAFVQLNTGDDITVGNFRFRFNPREGNDFYLVYNEILNNKPHNEMPNLLGTESRTILLKYTYTFAF